jgi:hypothetical protein
MLFLNLPSGASGGLRLALPNAGPRAIHASPDPELRTSLLMADRSQDNPHRFVRISLQFTIEGPVPADAVDRAIALFRDKYCSAWHSMRQDIAFTITWGLDHQQVTGTS